MLKLLRVALLLMGLLLILTTALLHTHRDGEGVPSLIARQGSESARLIQLLPLSHHAFPMTPNMRGLQLVAWTPNGLLYSALSGQGDTVLYRVSHIGATPELLADQLLSRMVVSEDGAWVVVMDSGGLGGNYGLRAIRTDGSEQHPLTLELQEDLEINQDMTPVVSPDGEWVAFVVFERTGDFDVYRVRLNGTGLENLTDEMTGVAQIVGWSAVSESFILIQDYVLWYWDEATDHLERLLPPTILAAVWVTDIPSAGLNLVYTYPNDVMVQAVHPDGSLAWESPATSGMVFAPDGSWGIGRYGNEWKRIRGRDGAVLPIDLPSDVEQAGIKWSPSLQTALIQREGINGFEAWLLDIDTGATQPALKPTPRVRLFHWSPDETYLVVEEYDITSYQYGVFRPGDSTIRWLAKNDRPPFSVFMDWGPAYQKTWSAGVLLVIGAACVVGAWIQGPRRFLTSG